jgi:hypothetical protein
VRDGEKNRISGNWSTIVTGKCRSKDENQVVGFRSMTPISINIAA